MEKGNISVSTENIFPIIKKSLYADQEIFLRELIANAIDASQKIRFLSSRGEFSGELGELNIRVSVDKDKRTITVSDHGVGMNAEEVKKYLNQVAFSGAEEFIKKYKDISESGEIIGKFGLGFYSAFMVAREVEGGRSCCKMDLRRNYELHAGRDPKRKKRYRYYSPCS